MPTLKNNPVQLLGSFVFVSNPLPDFTLVGTDLKEYSLSDFPNKKLLLSIFPSIDTSVCSLAANVFYEKLQSHTNLQLLLISRDLPFALQRFCKDLKGTNMLALSAFRSEGFGKKYGVEIASGPMKGLFTRAVLVTDQNHQVCYTELVSEITNEPNYDEAFKFI